MLLKTNATNNPLGFPRGATLFTCFLLLFFQISATAQGNLLVTPKRVVFEGNKRSEELNLANVGTDSATYVLSFIHFRMTANGAFERIDTPDTDQLFAEPFLRIFPRTVSLGPNESQTIKLQVRKTSDMRSGEYRSHLYFRAEPKQTPLGETGTGRDSAISVKLTPVFGISIPVIVRVGESNTVVQLENVRFQNDSIPAIDMTLQRKGNMSVYGDIMVNHISRQGKTVPVGMAKGLAVYSPNAERKFTLLLNPAANVNYQSGKLQVSYVDHVSKPVVLAEKEINLQ